MKSGKSANEYSESSSSASDSDQPAKPKLRPTKKASFFTFGKLFSLATVLVFTWFVSNWLLQVYLFFDPFVYIPYYTKRIEVDENMYYYPRWQPNDRFKLDTYMSAKRTHNNFVDGVKLWSVESDYKSINKEETNLNIKLPSTVFNNGTLYIHAYLYNPKKSPNPKNGNYDEHTLYSQTALTKYSNVVFNETRNLMDGGKDIQNSKMAKIESKYKNKIITHFKPFIQIELVVDRIKLPYGYFPHDIVDDIKLLRDSNTYLPIFYINEIGLRKAHLTPVIKELDTHKNLTLTFKSTKFGMYRIHKHFNTAFNGMLNNNDMPIKIGEKDIDNLRQMFFETSPTLLLATFLASFFHMLFEFLAFKSDINHYRKNTHTFTSVSKTSLILNCVTHAFSFVFLFDKIEETSRLVLFGAGASAIVEFWKFIRVYRYKPKVNKKNEKAIQKMNENEKLDKTLLKYTAILSLPISAIYSLYTLYYKEHKGVYSWGLDVAMAFIYLLGFVNMTPQVILNYKNKSVDAVPLKVFLFRAINTFIDDLFAFVIPMPTLTRLSMFRDDIIFIVFLYQWWKYPSTSLDHDKEE